MSATENDLRAVYVDPPGLDRVEQRVLNSVNSIAAHGSLPHQRRSWRVSAAPVLSVVVVAAIAVTVVVAAPRHGAGPSTAGVAAPSTTATTSTTSAAPSTAATSSAPTVPAATAPITPQAATQILIDLLPRTGHITSLSGESTTGQVGGQFIYNDGHGAAEVAISVGIPWINTNPHSPAYGQLESQTPGALCPATAPLAGEQCTTLPDGSQMSVYQGDANIPGGAKDWEVSLVRTDGVEVDVTEFNSPVEKGGEQTRADPPFTITELTAIVHGDQWQARVSTADANKDAGLFVPDVQP